MKNYSPIHKKLLKDTLYISLTFKKEMYSSISDINRVYILSSYFFLWLLLSCVYFFFTSFTKINVTSSQLWIFSQKFPKMFMFVQISQIWLPFSHVYFFKVSHVWVQPALFCSFLEAPKVHNHQEKTKNWFWRLNAVYDIQTVIIVFI